MILDRIIIDRLIITTPNSRIYGQSITTTTINNLYQADHEPGEYVVVLIKVDRAADAAGVEE